MSLCDEIEDRNIDRVRELCADGASVDEIDFEHEATPLEKAAEMGAADIAELLLAIGADVNKAMIEPPLCAAASGNHVGVMNVLIRAGARLEEPAEDGVTPLMCAAAGGQVEAARLLLESGADPLTSDRFGETALAKAEANAAEVDTADVRALLRR
jgi:ankyrin repeat protein